MLKFLVWLFHTPRVTWFDFVLFVVAVVFVEGWIGLLVLVIGLFVGTFVGGLARAWQRDIENDCDVGPVKK
jgi:hypothetical protein